MRCGLDLRELGCALSYRRLLVFLASSPDDSAYARSVRGDSWTLNDHLMALAVDHLAGANWQRGGGKGSPPKPLPRPGAKNPDEERITGKTMSLAEAKAWAEQKIEGG